MMKSSPIKKMPYIRIGVSDMKKAVSFYEGVLGLEKLSEWPSGAIFDVEGVALGVELEAKPEICLLVDDVDKAYHSLQQKGVDFVAEPKDQPWGVRDAAFEDPDGNRFVIESFQCKVCGASCQSYREFLEQHLKMHK